MRYIGGSGGACLAQAPPTGPNSFVFAYLFAKKCPRRRSTPPMGNSGSATEVHAEVQGLLNKSRCCWVIMTMLMFSCTG